MSPEVHRVVTTAETIQTTEEKIDAILASVQKTEKYFKATMIITIVMFVLPLLGIILLAPLVLSTISGALTL